MKIMRLGFTATKPAATFTARKPETQITSVYIDADGTRHVLQSIKTGSGWVLKK